MCVRPPVPGGDRRPMSEQVRAALAAVVEGRTLSLDEARLAMGSVMDGEATPAQLAALLVALRMRGETVDELAGFATAMRERVLRVEAPDGTIDVVGTGGDGSGTFNISTTSALVVAAAGVPVAKHGNRAITSRSGAADVLEALGVRVDHSAGSAAADLRELGFAFLFAPGFHPAMRHAGPTRREIGVRTAFNLLGPLTNPAGATRALLGVGDAGAAPRIAEVAGRLGTERTLVVHGAGVDELPLDGSGVILDVTPGGIVESRVDPAALGLRTRRDLRARRRHRRRQRLARRSRSSMEIAAHDGTSSSSTPAPRSWPPAGRPRSRTGSRSPRRRSTAARRGSSSIGCERRSWRPMRRAAATDGGGS